MYVSVGPPAFTALSFALLAEQSLRHFSSGKTAPDGAADIVGGVSLYYIGLVNALTFWGLSFWFFLISTFSNMAALAQMDISVQQLQMFSLIFPNSKLVFYGKLAECLANVCIVGFALATTHISRILGNPKVLAVASEILDLVIVGSWAIVVLATIFGIVSGRIFRG